MRRILDIKCVENWNIAKAVCRKKTTCSHMGMRRIFHCWNKYPSLDCVGNRRSEVKTFVGVRWPPSEWKFMLHATYHEWQARIPRTLHNQATYQQEPLAVAACCYFLPQDSPISPPREVHTQSYIYPRSLLEVSSSIPIGHCPPGQPTCRFMEIIVVVLIP